MRSGVEEYEVPGIVEFESGTEAHEVAEHAMDWALNLLGAISFGFGFLGSPRVLSGCSRLIGPSADFFGRDENPQGIEKGLEGIRVAGKKPLEINDCAKSDCAYRVDTHWIQYYRKDYFWASH